MGKALYRKYRSKSLDEIVGQEHITTSLKNALSSGKMSHAVLLSGPRGVGKTSIARILAHAVNGLDYNEASNHLDIIEIDAASNRRIDEIRELREKAFIAPAQAKYKIYIIDEVHMLTREAFNALLKTLEEPPAHVIFILATTEPHKLPETIISRTQRYNFKPIDAGKMMDHLRGIAKAEKIKISDEALSLIAEHGGGSFRDAISFLDQVRNFSDDVGVNDILALLGAAPDSSLASLVNVLETSSASDVVKRLEDLRVQGVNPANLAKQLAEKIRSGLLNGSLKLSKNIVLKLLNELIEVPAKPNPSAYLEISLLKAIYSGSQDVLQAVPEVIAKPPKSETKNSLTENLAQEKPVVSKPEGDFIAPSNLWDDCLAVIKKERSTLYGLARMARAEIDGATVRLHFKFAFHQKRLNDQKNRDFIAECLRRLTGKNFLVECLLDKKGASSTTNQQKDNSQSFNHSDIENISNIFGGIEVLD